MLHSIIPIRAFLFSDDDESVGLYAAFLDIIRHLKN